MKTTRLDQLNEAIEHFETNVFSKVSVILVKGTFRHQLLGEVYANHLTDIVNADATTIYEIPMRRSNDIEEGDFELY